MRALEGIFVLVALVAGGAMYAAAPVVATDWLHAGKLPLGEVEGSIRAMALIVSMRWMGGLYRGAISGAERLTWLGGFSATIATLRFLGVLPVFWLVGATPTVFFNFQLAVAEICGGR